MSEKADNFVEGVRSASFHFWQLVQKALRRECVKTSDSLEFYLTDLLLDFLRQDNPAAMLLAVPLLLELKKSLAAAERGDVLQFTHIRRIGDASLFTAGILGPRLKKRSLVGIRHYIDVSEEAYWFLCLHPVKKDDQLSAVYYALAMDLRPFVRILNEISREEIFPAQIEDIFSVYGEYLVTGSESLRRWLVNHKVAFLEGPDPKRIII